MRHRVVWILALAAGFLDHAYGYEQLTHRSITADVVRSSVLGDTTTSEARERRNRLGVRQSDDRRALYTNSKGDLERSAAQLIEDGVDFEDDGMRSLNHFTDPRTRKGLSVYGASTSVDWALGTYGAFHFPIQDRSYVDLKRYYLQALLGTSPTERKNSMALVYQTLGHIVHHIQDAAQPQHARNDVHLSVGQLESACKVVTPATPDIYLLCRYYAAARNPSFYEQWTRDLEHVYGRDLPLSGYGAVYVANNASSSWPGTAQRFFIGDGMGISEYSNRNFLTSGTMSEVPPVLEAPFDMTVGALCSGAVPPCGNVSPTLNVRFWPSVVEDRLRAERTPHPYAASSSILAPDFDTYAIQGVRSPMTVNRFTFEYDYAYLLPRAVGYSAGFINYFFRGNLDVRAPDEGVLGAVDLSQVGCGGGCGFSKLKVNVKNMTLGESIGAGSLYLVAQYRVNQCAFPDLSGEDGGSRFSQQSCRSNAPYFLVSKPITIDALPNDRFSALVFEFQGPTQIPINASDLSIQIVFRGQLGQESDAIVVSTLDVSEPNYVAVGNVTDYVFYDGDDKYAALKAGENPIVLNAVTFSFQDPVSSAPPLATLSGLTGGQHAQFAFITTKESRNYWLRTQSYPPFGHTDNAPFRVEEFFKDDDDAQSTYARTCKVVLERGRYRQYVMYYAQTAHGRFTDAAPGGAQPSALQSVDQQGAAKYASDCRGPVSPGTNGLFDFSYLTPYTNANAKPWTINFP
ncbi:MAG: hypothetical protein U1F41_16915 [Burkholderiales bacterium]